MIRIVWGKIAMAAVCSFWSSFGLKAADAFPSDRTTWAEPIVTISVADADQSLEAADIASMKAAGTVELVGSGRLTASSSLAGVTCPVHVCAGVVFRSTYGGPTAKAEGAFYVHTGATVFSDNSGANFSAAGTSKSGEIHLQGGEGADGQLAQYVILPGGSSSNLRLPLAKSLVLHADSTIAVLDGKSLVCESPCAIDLEGYFLTWRGTGTPLVDSLTIQHADGGGFIVDGGALTPRSMSATTGFRGNGEIRLINGGTLKFGEPHTIIEPIEWNVCWDGRGNLEVSLPNTDEYRAKISHPNAKNNRLGGTFELQTDLPLTNGATTAANFDRGKYKVLAFQGPVTGTGGIDASLDMNKGKWWDLSLMNPANDFAGGVKLRCGNLALYADGALPADGGALELDESSVELVGMNPLETWTLPTLTAKGSGTSAIRMLNGARAAWRRIEQTVSGTLVSEGAPETDALVLSAGKLVVSNGYRSVAGLYKGHRWSADYDVSSTKSATWKDIYVSEFPPDDTCQNGYFHVTNAVKLAEIGFDTQNVANNVDNGLGFIVRGGYDWDNKISYSSASEFGKASDDTLATQTNSLALGPDTAFGPDYSEMRRWNSYSYSGYVWNDSDQDVVWTLASGWNHYYKIKIGDNPIIRRTTNFSGADANLTGCVYKVTLKPGANPIVIKSSNQYVSSPNYDPIATNGFTNWSYELGLAYHVGDTDSKDGTDYRPFVDPGDGSLFTTELVPRNVRIGDLELTPGTAVEFASPADSPRAASTRLEIAGAVRFAAADIAAGHPVTLAVPVTFVEGATLACEGVLSGGTTGEVLVFAAPSIEGCPSLASDLSDQWRLVMSGTEIKLVSAIRGGGETLTVAGKAKMETDYAAVAGLDKALHWFADYNLSAVTKDSEKKNVYVGETAPLDAYYSKGYLHVTNSAAIGDYNYYDTNKNGHIGFAVKQGNDWSNSKSCGKWYEACNDPAAETPKGTVVDSPDTAFATTLAECPRYHVYTYAGYIWNNSHEDVVWTLAASWNHYYEIKINGEIALQRTANWDNTEAKRAQYGSGSVGTVALHPGANRFTVKTYNQYVGATALCPIAMDGFVNWSYNLGLAYAVGAVAAGSVDGNDFKPLRDAGDGRLFTYEENGIRPAYTNLVFSGDGAVLDLGFTGFESDRSVRFESITGFGSFSAGDVIVTETLKLAKADIAAGKTLAVAGKLTLTGASLELLGDEALARPPKALNKTYTLVTAEGGIEGVPKLPMELDSGKWRLVLSDDGKSLLLTYGSGFMLIAR